MSKEEYFNSTQILPNQETWQLLGNKIVVIGCGQGRELNGGLRVSKIGVDINYRVLSEQIQPDNNPTRLVQADIEDGLPFRSNSFTGGTMIGVMEQIINFTSRIKIVEEIYRILKQRGYVYVSDFERNLGDKFDKNRYRKHHRSDNFEWGTFSPSNGRLVHHFSSSELHILFATHFDVISEQRKVVSTPNSGRRVPSLIYLLRKKNIPDTSWIDEALFLF